MRLQSTLYFMPFLPLSVIAYGWVCQQHVHVSAICVMLFLAGLFSMFVSSVKWNPVAHAHPRFSRSIYTSTLAYIVDANTGRSSSAVAANSAFRGLTAFIATEVAAPLQVRERSSVLRGLWLTAL